MSGAASGEQAKLVVTLDLQGPPEFIATAFATQAVENIQQFSPLEQRVVVSIASQTEVDTLVDQLRAAGISVVGLSRKRMSLEQHYLEIVAQNVSQ